MGIRSWLGQKPVEASAPGAESDFAATVRWDKVQLDMSAKVWYTRIILMKGGMV
jgi:hypothetical protein